MPDQTPYSDDLMAHVREHKGRFRWLGIALIVAGALAVIFPLVASITAKIMVGWFLLIVGAVTLWHAFQSRSWREAILSGLVGVLQIAAGVYLAFFPLTGLIGLTLLLGVLFAFQGGIEIAMAMRARPTQGWVWMLVSGIASALLAIFLIAGLPGTALWAIGLLLGVNFLTSGFAFLALSRIA
ncbi:HdeD family acid-resistance protein [Pelagovum pacificum]|uniref:HdeD family acid-resistance protein n=1 Tax=Pelagovum pacificum TaxID=2588711 RepID=A0A5C5G9S5_9RHOB|nr:HdeD family acid-resistance protein [Pelagovum pacificum]QQA41818.1 HdeD family acid-resistance protein [Pelagovum pacificum]TNY30738.1 HdeD family acid-resistance protein [Pelagovum pacificum]